MRLNLHLLVRALKIMDAGKKFNFFLRLAGMLELASPVVKTGNVAPQIV